MSERLEVQWIVERRPVHQGYATAEADRRRIFQTRKLAKEYRDENNARANRKLPAKFVFKGPFRATAGPELRIAQKIARGR